MRAGYTITGSDRPMDNHPAGRCSSKRIITDIYRIGKLGQHKHVPSRMESESVNCHTMTYKNQEVGMEDKQTPPELTDSESESDSDMEDELRTEGSPRCQHDKELRTKRRAPRKAILDGVIRSEAWSSPRIDHIKDHHPVGRNSSVPADKHSLLCDRQLPGRQLARYVSTRLGYEPQGNPAELSKDLREGETRVCIVGTDVDDADEVHNLRPLALTDSKRGEERSKVLEGSERPPEEERRSP